MNSLQKVLDFLNRLDESGFGYSLEHNRESTLTVLVAVPGERWEVEFHADGEVDVEVFYSDDEQEGLEGEEALERLFSDYADDEEFEDEEDDGFGVEIIENEDDEEVDEENQEITRPG